MDSNGEEEILNSLFKIIDNLFYFNKYHLITCSVLGDWSISVFCLVRAIDSQWQLLL